MPSFYSIIQYVPDPITDERINIGVVALDDHGAQLKFIEHWDRVREFADRDVKSLKQFVRDLRDRQLVLGENQPAWTIQNLRRYASDWRQSLQFSEPRASLKTAHELVEEIGRRFLVDAPATAYAYRTRTAAINIGKLAVRAALRERVGPARARELLKLRYPLTGARSVHHFDIVAANGRPLFAAQALSLEMPDARSVEKDINAAGWSLRDLKNQNQHFPASIFALLPQDGNVDADLQANIGRMRSVVDELHIPLLTTSETFEHWAAEQPLQI